MIEITTLGRATIRRDGAELGELSAHKQKFALLVYLAMEGPVTRDRLLTLFWPERDEERARHSLSQALYALKRELRDECVLAKGDQVSVAAGAVMVDAAQLEAAARQEEWERVIDLYRGPFLAQFSLPEAPDFDEWQSSTRARLARTARRGFPRVVGARVAAGDLAGALEMAGRWAAADPLEDEAQHTLITLLARSGQRSAALEGYEEYRACLARELGVEPLEQTIELVERIRAGELPEFHPLGATRRADAAPSAREPSAAHAARVEEEAHQRTGWMALVEELRTRRVYQVAAAYLAFAVLALELTSTLIERAIVAAWVFPLLLLFLALGLPFALILAWAQERPGHRPWPRWAEKVRGGHVLLVLGALVLGAVVGLVALGRRSPTASTVEETAFDLSSIAVLPFSNLSEGRRFAYLAEGFTKALIDDLTQFEPIVVRSHVAVKRYENTDLPPDSIARALEVGTLVGGSVALSGDRLRVSVQMIDPATGANVYSKTLDRPWRQLFDLQDDVAREVSMYLRQRLGLEIGHRSRRAGTASVAAWTLVQQAEEARESASEISRTGDPAAAARELQRADSMLAAAEALDPAWVEPIVSRGWLALDRARLLAATPQTYDRTRLAEGVAHAERALALKPGDPGALELRGTLRYFLHARADAPAQAQTALQAAEEDLRAATSGERPRARALAYLAQVLGAQGRLAEAKVAARRALEADAFLRFDELILFTFGQTLMDVGEYKEAFSVCEEGLLRSPDEAAFVNCMLVALASADGPEPDVDRALELLETFERFVPPDPTPYGQVLAAAVLARAGLADSARAVMRRARAGTRDDPGLWMVYYEANARLLLGETDEALRLLARFLEANPARKDYIAQDPWWLALHDDSRFKAMVGRE